MNNQEIVQTGDAKQPTAGGHQQSNPNLTPYVLCRWPSVVAASVLAALAGGGAWGFWWASGKILDVAASWNFFAQNTLSLFIVLGVVAQALVYMSQRKVMYEQWRAMSIAINPRLRISKVETTSFVNGRTPVFIVTLSNEGATDALDVSVYLRAELGSDRSTNLHQEQTITIPAHSSHDYFIRWVGPLNDEVIEAINDGKQILKVIGTYEYAGKKPIEFCYRFNPWPWNELRPDRLPHFIPCELVTTQNISIVIGGASLKATGYAPTMIHGKAASQQARGITPSGDVANVVIHGDRLKPPQASVEKKEEGEEKSGEAN